MLQNICSATITKTIEIIRISVFNPLSLLGRDQGSAFWGGWYHPPPEISRTRHGMNLKFTPVIALDNWSTKMVSFFLPPAACVFYRPECQKLQSWITLVLLKVSTWNLYQWQILTIEDDWWRHQHCDVIGRVIYRPEPFFQYLVCKIHTWWRHNVDDVINRLLLSRPMGTKLTPVIGLDNKRRLMTSSTLWRYQVCILQTRYRKKVLVCKLHACYTILMTSSIVIFYQCLSLV